MDRTKFTERKNIPVSTEDRAIETGKGGKCLRCLKEPLFRDLMIQKCIEKNARNLNDLKSYEN